MKKMLMILALAGVMLLAGCATTRSTQDAQDRKDAWNRQQAVYEQDRQVAATIAAAAMNVCAQDSNPGLCAQSVMSTYGMALKTNAPQVPSRQYHPGWSFAAKGLDLVSKLGGAWILKEQNQDNLNAWTDIVGTVATNGGTHVGGDFIQGDQDNSVDNSLNAGNDLVTGTQDQSDNSVSVGRDATGRDHVDNSGIIHDGDNDRYNSPGPFDNDCQTGNSAASGSTGACNNEGG